MNLPLVTIVTPSFNQGQFLERTIQSVVTQDYPNIEYIVMDGGSTDKSVDVIKKYADKISFWVSEKDGGQSDAINKGWARATGTYCSYLNSDDLLQPGAVAAVVQKFLKHPDAGMVYGDYSFIDEMDTVMAMGAGKQTTFKRLLVDGQMPAVAQPSSFYLTSLVRNVGYLDQRLHLSMDYDLILKIAKASPIVYVREPISCFRVHRNAKSATLTKRHWHESIKVRLRYSAWHSLKAMALYLRFRVFQLLPLPIQNFLRRRRNSIQDKLSLIDKTS